MWKINYLFCTTAYFNVKDSVFWVTIEKGICFTLIFTYVLNLGENNRPTHVSSELSNKRDEWKQRQNRHEDEEENYTSTTKVQNQNSGNIFLFIYKIYIKS